MLFVILALLVVIGVFLSLFMEIEELSREQFDEGLKKLFEEEDKC